MTLLKILMPIAGLVAAAFSVYRWRNTTFTERAAQTATSAGFSERRYVSEGAPSLNYVEGPANGPPVVLLHAQSAAWESYIPVLPGLADGFHVFAPDIVGHGSSDRTPGEYDVHTIGRDLARFIEVTMPAPVILSGHSSGGLLAAWVASQRPDLVSGVVFEDPPFFSTAPDRMPQQFNYVDLAKPSHDFLAQDEETDFPLYYLAHNAWIEYVGNGKGPMIRSATRYRRKHPDGPMLVPFLPPAINQTFAYMHEFDPQFADAFYEMSWQSDWDQEASLTNVQQPSILVHANWRITQKGILEGAMTDDDATRAHEAMADSTMVRWDCGHSVHSERPDEFIALFTDIRRRIDAASQT